VIIVHLVEAVNRYNRKNIQSQIEKIKEYHALKKNNIAVIVLIKLTSCVSKKIYTDLESKYGILKKRKTEQPVDANQDLETT
jgi:hypothetical protein